MLPTSNPLPLDYRTSILVHHLTPSSSSTTITATNTTTNTITTTTSTTTTSSISSNSTPLLSVSQRECKLPPFFLGSCRNIDDFVKGKKVGEGTYGVVYRVQGLWDHPHQQYAVKRIRMSQDNDGFPLPSLREVSLLKQLLHPNIVRVHEVVVGKEGLDKTYMLMEFCDRDLATLLDTLPTPLKPLEVACLMYQLFQGLSYLHSRFIIHRDLKLANLLLTNSGILKIADFGLARKFSLPTRPMTPKVVTLWYRAPELLLGEKIYTIAIDCWSVGCIFGELLIHKPLLPGQTEVEQISLIIHLIGSPNEMDWPHWQALPQAQCVSSRLLSIPSKLSDTFSMLPPPGFEVLQGLLSFNPLTRWTPQRALQSSYFHSLPNGSQVLLANPNIQKQIHLSEDQAKHLNEHTQLHRKRRRLEG